MFPRHFFFFAVCVLALLAVVTVRADEEEEGAVEERQNPLISVAIRIIAKQFAKASLKCLKEAAENCKSHWSNKNDLIDCAKQFFEDNKGRCALG